MVLDRVTDPFTAMFERETPYLADIEEGFLTLVHRARDAKQLLSVLKSLDERGLIEKMHERRVNAYGTNVWSDFCKSLRLWPENTAVAQWINQWEERHALIQKTPPAASAIGQRRI